MSMYSVFYIEYELFEYFKVLSIKYWRRIGICNMIVCSKDRLYSWIRFNNSLHLDISNYLLLSIVQFVVFTFVIKANAKVK